MSGFDNFEKPGIFLIFALMNSFRAASPVTGAGNLKGSHGTADEVDLPGFGSSVVKSESSNHYGNVPTKRRGTPTVLSASPGVQSSKPDYYDLPYGTWKEYTPSSPYLGSKYFSDPVQNLMPFHRDQRLSFPDYLVPDVRSSYISALPSQRYISDASLELLPAASHHSNYGHSEGSSHGGGHDEEYGHQPHRHVVKKKIFQVSAVTTDSLGLLSLLGLLGLLQSVLRLLTTTTTTRRAGRRKRNVDDEVDEDVVSDNQALMDEVSKRIVASFNIIAHAQAGRVGFNCTQTETCRANQIMIKSLGERGRIASMRITNRIKDMLGRIDSSPQASESIMLAAAKGRLAKTEKDCEVAYPFCKALEIDGVYSLPSILPASHPLYYDYQEKARMAKK